MNPIAPYEKEAIGCLRFWREMETISETFTPGTATIAATFRRRNGLEITYVLPYFYHRFTADGKATGRKYVQRKTAALPAGGNPTKPP
jgi:hypothetical protein